MTNLCTSFTHYQLVSGHRTLGGVGGGSERMLLYSLFPLNRCMHSQFKMLFCHPPTVPTFRVGVHFAFCCMSWKNCLGDYFFFQNTLNRGWGVEETTDTSNSEVCPSLGNKCEQCWKLSPKLQQFENCSDTKVLTFYLDIEWTKWICKSCFCF